MSHVNSETLKLTVSSSKRTSHRELPAKDRLCLLGHLPAGPLCCGLEVGLGLVAGPGRAGTQHTPAATSLLPQLCLCPPQSNTSF